MGQGGGAYPGPAEITTFLTEFYDSIKNASDCRGLGYQITYSWEEDSVLSYGPSPEVERKGVMQFNAGGFISSFSWPGLKADAVSADGINMPRTGTTFSGAVATHLQSIHDKLQNGATVGIVNFPVVDRRGVDFSGLVDAYQQHRRNSRG
jgi:hypothetical protein